MPSNADLAKLAREYLGVCYDVCHQAVEFEDVAESLKSLDAAGIRINKVHITCAIDLGNPADNEAGRKMLAGFVEQRYLHQTFALFADGNIRTITDLSEDLCLNPPPHMAEAIKWAYPFSCSRKRGKSRPFGNNTRGTEDCTTNPWPALNKLLLTWKSKPTLGA